VNRIRLLSEQVANQIAAGEVIERPASVVKELVENALDAEAGRIDVTIRNGGKSSIRVEDNGFGMGRDDALMALERHATSKISKAEDLHTIHSLGFRGEAMPSIAAVSRFTLMSREHDALAGTQVEISGGKILSVKDTGTAEGTSIEVRNLFFNLPARRKFLRTVPTETAHIQHVVTLCALAHPDVGFRLAIDEREVFNVAPAKQLLDRLAELYGRQLVDELSPVDFEGEEVTIRGYVGKAGVSRGNRSRQHLFVNARPVENRGINYALTEGYHTALMKGRFPVTFLFVEIDPAQVDVNIHPAKREVRFRNEFDVRQCVTDAVRGAIYPKNSLSAPTKPGASAYPFQSRVPVGPSHRSRPYRPMENIAPGDGAAYVNPAIPIVSTQSEVPPGKPVQEEIQTESENLFNILGVIGRLYIIAESREGLVLIDQHAAHERVLFEKMLKQLNTEAAPSQKLLLPVTLEFDVRDAAYLRDNVETLQKFGIGVSEFGEKTFLVDALPPYLPLGDLTQTFRSIVDELRQTGEQVHARRLGEDKIATTVCRHAVKAHDPLKGEELRALLQQLDRCDLPYTCPHGRPTMIQISYAELEKKFGRKI